MKQNFTPFSRSCLLYYLSALVLLWLPVQGWAQSPNIVISQVYGGGGNSGATYNQDFVELFNRSASPVTITGWTIQYASATGLFSSTTPYVITTATIPARGYYLIGIGTPTVGTGSALSTDQPIGNATAISSGFAASAGKVALANNASVVTYTAPNTFSANVVDVVGYGATANAYEGASAASAATATTTALVRAGAGCTDTNSNGSDFAVVSFANGLTAPRNASTAASNCTNPVLVVNPAALAFAAPAGRVAAVATYTLAGFNLAANAPITISSNNAAVLVSASGGAGSFASTATVNTTATGTLTQTISVQFTAPAMAGPTTATISNSGSGLTASVAVTGTSLTAYTWNGTSTSFSNSSSWTPARSTPSGSADVLLFDGSITPAPAVVLDYASTQTIGQLQFVNNVAATLSTDGNRALTLDGNVPGDDLLIQAGSTVTVAHSTSAAATSTLTGLTITLNNLETASIGGSLIFTGYLTNVNGRHTLLATNAEAIQFLNGSRFQAASTYTGVNPFGNAAANAGSVVFRNGSRYEQAGGLTPFGSTTPAVTAFEPASIFLFSAASGAPSLAARTYGTLIYDVSGVSTASGVSSQATLQGDLLVRNGTVSISGTGGISVLGNVQVANAASFTLATTGLSTLQGNVEVNNTATLSVAPASAATLQLSGATSQTLGGTSTATTPIAFNTFTTLQISNAAGVVLGIPLLLPGTLQLTNGVLTTTNANSLTLSNNPQGGSNASFVNGPVIRPASAPGSYVFPIGKGASFRPITLNISAQNGTTYYRAEQIEGNPGQNVTGSGLTRVSKIRAYIITPFASVADAAAGVVTQPSGFVGTVTLSFGNNDGVTDPSQLVVAKRPNASSAWTNAGYTAGSATASTVTSGVIISFSDFALGYTSAELTVNPLPVVLTSFAATRQASGAVQARWATASEQHSAYFEVQRSLDGRSFAAGERVTAQGTTAQTHAYTSLDQTAPAGLLYYRLRQVDTDGTESFSPVVTLAATTALTLYPNPAHDELTLPAAGELVQVLDLAGRVLQATTLPTSGKLSIATLAPGTYLLRVALNGQPHVLRFTKE